MGEAEREFLVTREVWRAAVLRARALDAYRQRPVGQWPYVWGLKAPRVLLRWYDYAMGRITGEDAGSGKVRCTLLILGCTGEIRNPAAYARLREQFFSELLDQSAAAEQREGDRTPSAEDTGAVERRVRLAGEANAPGR
ncbi:MAG: hypothetical protein HY726_01105 [Candidatus Rokubacteria bacterium]|nr:hypothetical protein [Candidatus Rokubacteria bacterium]